MRRCVAILALAACGKGAPGPGATSGSGSATAAVGSGSAGCEPLPFATSTPLPEASAAAWLVLDGKPALVAIGDSGQHGAYAILDPETGQTLEQGALPLDHGSDDLEGLAGRGELLYGLSSAGWIRVWRRDGHGFTLVDGPYPLGPVDLPVRGGLGDKPPVGDGMVCPIDGVNCGRNYEGLCLAPRGRDGEPPLPCQGFAASKADGHLYCLTDAPDARLAVHREQAIAVGRPGVVADCAFGDDGSLWVGDNLFGMSAVLRVDGWTDPAHAKLDDLGPLGTGFPEAIAVRGDVVYRMSDTGGAPSLIAKFRCPAPAR